MEAWLEAIGPGLSKYVDVLDEIGAQTPEDLQWLDDSLVIELHDSLAAAGAPPLMTKTIIASVESAALEFAAASSMRPDDRFYNCPVEFPTEFRCDAELWEALIDPAAHLSTSDGACHHSSALLSNHPHSPPFSPPSYSHATAAIPAAAVEPLS